MTIILFPVPYGLAGRNGLSEVSRRSFERAIRIWDKSFRSVKDQTILVLGAFAEDYEEELKLKKKLLGETFGEEGSWPRLIIIAPAKSEEDLAVKLRQALKPHLPVQNLIVIAEKLHALMLKQIFLRRFGTAVEFRTFKCDFESNHTWILTFSPAWFLKNVVARLWFGAKRRLGRRFRKSLRRLFWS